MTELDDALLCAIYYAALTARKQFKYKAVTLEHQWIRDLRALRDGLVLAGYAP